MKLYYKLLLAYNFIRCLTGLYYYIINFITIVQLPYSVLIQIYFLLSWTILSYLVYNTVKILNNKILIFLLLFQMVWTIIYVSLESKPYKYILYDSGLCFFIYSCFFIYQLWYNKRLNKLTNNEVDFDDQTNHEQLINTVDYMDL